MLLYNNECYYIRALQKYILQNRESAMKDFNMAIQHNPNYADAYYNRGLTHIHLGNNKLGIQDLSKAGERRGCPAEECTKYEKRKE